MKNKRIFYLDFIRVIACLAIFTTHFNAGVCGYQDDAFLFPQNAIFPIFVFKSVYLGNLGSAFFFMLSGAGLQISTSSQNRISLKSYYYKRAKSIFPSYWISWFLFTGVSFLRNHCLPSAPLWNLIMSIIGMDGYLSRLGLPGSGFYAVGEWFLGCLLLIYLLWPFIYYMSMKYPVGCAAVLAAIYLCLVKRVSVVFFLIRIPEVLFGMYFVRYIREPKVKHAIIALVLLPIVMLLENKIINLSYSSLISACLFTIFAWLGSLIKAGKITALITKLAALSWPVILVHHQIIAMICPYYAYDGLAKRNLYMLYVVVLTISLAVAWTVKKLSSKIVSGVGLNTLKL